MSLGHGKRHGGAYDRGGADSYYGRPPNPHYYEQGTRTSPRVEESRMSPAQVKDYYQGYNDNEEIGDHKDWG